MKILVTGGSGFIGSHLVERLLQEEDNRIIVVDDFSEGKWDNLPKDNRLVTIGASILDDVGYTFEDVDVVFHLAALTRPRWSIEYPTETTKVNVEGTARVLKHCLDKGVRRLVFTSSASAYGNQEKFPLTEDMVLNPMSPYALTKQVGEQYCRLFGRLYGLNYNIVRPFNVYGTRQNLYGEYSAAVSKFIDQLSKDETPRITGDGKQVRDFVYVEDVVELMVACAESEVNGETFNAGSGKSTSINDLYATISRLMGKNISPVYVAPVIDPETQADISKAKQLLGWEPKVELEDGLRMTIEGNLK